jgi:uncharacterized iron-regulated membrane protein
VGAHRRDVLDLDVAQPLSLGPVGGVLHRLGVAATYATAATSTGPGVAEAINGRPATHYAMVVDTTQLPGAADGDPTNAHVDVWIDDLNRPVKVMLTATISGQAVQTTVTSGNFDAPVTVTPPPAADVSH